MEKLVPKQQGIGNGLGPKQAPGKCYQQKSDLEQISEEVRTAAYKIIEAKNATYYGIGMAMTRITKAILGDEHSVLTVSAMLRGEYNQSGVFVGVPCIINQNGIQRVLTLDLNDEELKKLDQSCQMLKRCYEELDG